MDVPKPLGRDNGGRNVVEYVEGVLALDELPLGQDEADDALREALPAAMAQRTAAMFNLLKSANETRFQPWADMYLNGHGEHWRGAARYVAQHQAAWERARARA